jgi:predicted DNA-binding transcriptional regulator
MPTNTWRPYPLYTVILETLEKKGPLTDVELYDLLKEKHKDLGIRNINRTLIKMEIEGKICVSTLTKGKRQIELVDQGRS